MAHFKCSCGNSISNVGCPNQIEGQIHGIYEYTSHDVWECLDCGRLWIKIAAHDFEGLNVLKCYIPEGSPGHLFHIGTGEQLIEYLKKLWSLHKKTFLQIEEGVFDD